MKLLSYLLSILLPVVLIGKVFFKEQLVPYEFYVDNFLLAYEVYFWVMFPVVILFWMFVTILNKKSETIVSLNSKIDIEDLQKALNKISETDKARRFFSALIPFEAVLILIGLDDMSFGIVFVFISMLIMNIQTQTKVILKKIITHEEKAEKTS